MNRVEVCNEELACHQIVFDLAGLKEGTKRFWQRRLDTNYSFFLLLESTGWRHVSISDTRWQQLLADPNRYAFCYTIEKQRLFSPKPSSLASSWSHPFQSFLIHTYTDDIKTPEELYMRFLEYLDEWVVEELFP